MRKWFINTFILIFLLHSCKQDNSAIYKDYIKQFEESIQIFNKKNNIIYTEFNYLMFDNPVRTGPWNKRVQLVKKNKNILICFIDSIQTNLDTDIVKKILNHENVKKNQLDKKVRLKKSEIDSLKNNLTYYKNTIVSLIDDKKKFSKLTKSILVDLSTDNLSNLNSYQPNSVSLAEMLACLIKLKANITMVETDILHYLYSQVEYSGAFRFWKTEVLVVPNSNILPEGIQYKAEVYIAKIDTTSIPFYEIDGQLFEANSGKGYYSRKITEKPGKYTYPGNFILGTGEIQKIPFKIEYEVMQKK